MSHSRPYLNISYPGPSPFNHSSELDIHPQISTSPSIHIPIPSLSSIPQSTDEERIEDWNDSVHDLLEWVGMALLGSQRYYQHHIYYVAHKSIVLWEQAGNKRQTGPVYCCLHATSTDPNGISNAYSMERAYRVYRCAIHCGCCYVSPCRIFVGLMVLIMEYGSASLSQDPEDPESFISITSIAIPTSPVTYIPQDPGKHAPLRVAQEGAEDAWSLILTKANWILAESVGRQDAR